jgi:hypothetical protein
VAALALPADGLLDQFALIVSAFQLPSASGVQLDALGALLGLARAGRDDGTYRAWLQAQELVLRSRGRPDELLKILQLTAPGAALEFTEGPGFEVLFAAPVVSVSVLGQILDRAKSAGIRLWVIGSSSPDVFRFDTGAGFDTAVWADSYASP